MLPGALQAHVDVEVVQASHLIALEAPDDNCAEERVEEEEEEDGGEPELAVHDMRSVRVRLAHGDQTQVGEVEQKDYGHWHEGVELKHLHVPERAHHAARRREIEEVELQDGRELPELPQGGWPRDLEVAVEGGNDLPEADEDLDVGEVVRLDAVQHQAVPPPHHRAPRARAATLLLLLPLAVLKARDERGPAALEEGPPGYQPPEREEHDHSHSKRGRASGADVVCFAVGAAAAGLGLGPAGHAQPTHRPVLPFGADPVV
mmetsp:Transcript_13598/g.31967  ORF Transcript_13598/g.31967 Transcript_13598/m.31967 type:complete len:261 (-) Transcript_13598:267-1049(-)